MAQSRNAAQSGARADDFSFIRTDELQALFGALPDAVLMFSPGAAVAITRLQCLPTDILPP